MEIEFSELSATSLWYHIFIIYYPDMFKVMLMMNR